jgi:hypothetical protein
MSKINNTTAYPTVTPASNDLVVITDVSDSNATKTATVGSISSGSTASEYDSYVALITQAGTAAPVATVLSNNLTATLTWARTGVGVYTLTANAATFTANKTIVFLNAGSGITLISAERTSDTVLTVKTFIPGNGAATDAVITNGAFEVRIYT